MRRISRAAGVLILLAATVGFLRAAAADEPAPRPRAERFDLEKLIAEFKPPYEHPPGPADPAITFSRFDVLAQPGFFDQNQTHFLSIGADGSYLMKFAEVETAQGEKLPGSNLFARLSPERMRELEKLLSRTAWLTAAGGEGVALHTDAATTRMAVTRNGQRKIVTLEGHRPEPYAALQKFIGDIGWQERIVYRLMWFPADRQAASELHDAIGDVLGLPGRGKPIRTIDFGRYEHLFARHLDQWYASQSDDLCTAIDLVTLLKRTDRAQAIARLRFDRDSRVRDAVARRCRH